MQFTHIQDLWREAGAGSSKIWKASRAFHLEPSGRWARFVMSDVYRTADRVWMTRLLAVDAQGNVVDATPLPGSCSHTTQHSRAIRALEQFLAEQEGDEHA
jgi:hypothetical protein